MAGSEPPLREIDMLVIDDRQEAAHPPTDSSPQPRPATILVLATIASLLPVLAMLAVVFVVPRYFAQWVAPIPLAAGFGAASIVGLAIVSAALVVAYVMVAINEGATQAAFEERRTQAVAAGFESREHLALVRNYLGDRVGRSVEGH